MIFDLINRIILLIIVRDLGLFNWQKQIFLIKNKTKWVI
jgi:hypothetical protein